MEHPVVVVGHPFAPIGMGEHLRSALRALRTARVPVRLLDVYGVSERDPELLAEFGQILVSQVGPGTAIFCINGNEVEPVLTHLGQKAEGAERRIIFPAWELANYPREWASLLERFDEVWAHSKYNQISFAKAVSRPVEQFALPVQLPARRSAGRRTFGIPDDAFVFLFFFDLTSFIERKNPYDALRAFRRACELMPEKNIHFVIKMNSSSAKPTDRDRFVEFALGFGSRVTVIDRTMPKSEVNALITVSDAFISLHRAEGYGFGLAEAMLLGKPVIATGYSGNMEFMHSDNSFPVGYRLVPVQKGAYPFGEGQVWAEPNVAEAAQIMSQIVRNPAIARQVGEIASRHIRQQLSFRAVGLRMAEHLRTKYSEQS